MKKILYILIIITLVFGIDKKSQTLGRINDPKTIEDIHPATMWFKKTIWEFQVFFNTFCYISEVYHYLFFYKI